jgi:hypothetical protein
LTFNVRKLERQKEISLYLLLRQFDRDVSFRICLQVRHRAEDGAIDTVVRVPVPNVTCCALGGANLRTLYITTTRRKMTEEELLEKPEAGSLFQVEVPVPGLPEPEFNLSLM